LSASSQAYSDPEWEKDNTWLTLDIYHLSRALPVGDKFVRFPFNPGFQATYHRIWLGEGALTGGTTLQAGYSQFDRLFWAMHLGGGMEGPCHYKCGAESH
jgi:hypothetical protein